MGGGVKKVFGGVGKALSKGVGAITGTNAAKKAAEQQANQLKQQQLQEAQLAAQSARDAAVQTQAKQSTMESQAARDAAAQAAQEQQKRAQNTEGDSVDVDVGGSGGGVEVDSEGRRVNVRDSFMSKGAGGSGLRL